MGYIDVHIEEYIIYNKNTNLTTEDTVKSGGPEEGASPTPHIVHVLL